uniref:Uncharacterized protein n=1 Tax=Anguilla anguilla TaxID=7936 RepID=A0A0E9Q479_ANGAN
MVSRGLYDTSVIMIPGLFTNNGYHRM